MYIERDKYDQLPFAIQTGALQLWGTLLASYQQANELHQLYQFNDFLAELHYNQQQQVVGISTFPVLIN
ncbi:hypothetical protein HNV11_13825 [Spirosoma taeanense]|uniref:Uncharacterized protein n=1 Tax=Spirosoma taeanense TaxID=2735870 RepID=A0A6M5Y7Q6_9BACT|nr:hypothetical protein [Spirosoma taeanense]QJW90378.1 hypothetical protein HNV11_13825 [Spirosoma taeanense]